MLCNGFFLSHANKAFMWACTCMCVYVQLACMTTPLPSMRQHLREAAMEMCARPQHTNTHTQTNKHCAFSALGPSFGLCLFLCSSSFIRSLRAFLLFAVFLSVQ